MRSPRETAGVDGAHVGGSGWLDRRLTSGARSVAHPNLPLTARFHKLGASMAIFVNLVGWWLTLGGLLQSGHLVAHVRWLLNPWPLLVHSMAISGGSVARGRGG